MRAAIFYWMSHVRCVFHRRKLIVDNFIPAAEVKKIKGRAVLNAETNEWTLTPVQASDRLSQYMNISLYAANDCQTVCVTLCCLLCLQFRHSCSQTSVKSRQSETHVNLCQDSCSNRKPPIYGIPPFLCHTSITPLSLLPHPSLHYHTPSPTTPLPATTPLSG